MKNNRKIEKYVLRGLFSNWRARTGQEELALKLIRRLHKEGFERTYIVGGYVRDMLMKKKDTGMIDIATEATPKQVQKLFSKSYKVIPTGLKHGTVTVHHALGDIEITTFRTEGKYTDSRHPDKVRYVKDAMADSKRRDFTINALYFDPSGKLVYDFHGGYQDLAGKKLRFIGSATSRIKEDALRLLRAVRFSASLGVMLSTAEIKTLKSNASRIKKIAPERIKQELDKVVVSDRVAEGFELMRTSHILANIMPELDRLFKTPQSKNYHSEGNVFVHTMLAFDKLEKDADLNTRYGLLFHDLGKADTVRKVRRGGSLHTTFHNHQNVGVEQARELMKRLRFSNAEIEDITWYIKNHHVPFELRKMRPAKQMAWCLDHRFGNLLKLYRADSLASIPTDHKGRQKKPQLTTYDYSRRLYKKAQGKKTLQKRLITGEDVMKRLGIKQGPDVGKVLVRIRELQLAGKLKTRSVALKHLSSLKG